VTAALPAEARGRPLEVWWQDEARVGQQGTLTRVWAARGSRPAAPKDCRCSRACLFGAVCPARGVAAGLVLPAANQRAMSLHLAEISLQVAPGAHAVVVMDGAGWRQRGPDLKVPAKVTPLLPPPDAPELNPIENIWAFLRSNKLGNRVFDAYDAILDACCDTWNRLADQPKRITAIASRAYAQVTF
jgi:transposase